MVHQLGLGRVDRRLGDSPRLSFSVRAACSRLGSFADPADQRTCPFSRRLFCRRVLEEGWTLEQAAEAAGCSVRTAAKWVRRFRDGDRELLDSSRPHRSPSRLPAHWSDAHQPQHLRPSERLLGDLAVERADLLIEEGSSPLRTLLCVTSKRHDRAESTCKSVLYDLLMVGHWPRPKPSEEVRLRLSLVVGSATAGASRQTVVGSAP